MHGDFAAQESTASTLLPWRRLCLPIDGQRADDIASAAAMPFLDSPFLGGAAWRARSPCFFMVIFHAVADSHRHAAMLPPTRFLLGACGRGHARPI